MWDQTWSSGFSLLLSSLVNTWDLFVSSDLKILFPAQPLCCWQLLFWALFLKRAIDQQRFYILFYKLRRTEYDLGAWWWRYSPGIRGLHVQRELVSDKMWGKMPSVRPSSEHAYWFQPVCKILAFFHFLLTFPSFMSGIQFFPLLLFFYFQLFFLFLYQ